MRTSITNNSGETKYFGWIPPHGQSLEDGEEVVLEGDLRTVLAGGRGRYSRKQEISGLNYDVDEGNVVEADAPGPSSSSSSA